MNMTSKARKETKKRQGTEDQEDERSGSDQKTLVSLVDALQ